MTKRAIGIMIGLLALSPQIGSLAHGQILHPTGDRPSFEVATIKPWQRTPPPPPADGAAPAKVMKMAPVGEAPPPTQLMHMIWPISVLITSAYNLPLGSEHRIIGGPDWLRQDIDQYEIQAKIEDAEYAAMQKMAPAQQREKVALMEQSLLADRFNLKVHFETKELPVYALVATKRGPTLAATKSDESRRLSMVGNARGGEMTAVAMTLEQFVHSPFLTGLAGGLPVMDQTGLKGAYDFTLKWNSEIGADAPSFFTAIQEQLGLRLVASKAQVEVIVIDHIEQPSAN
jgi:bla regulator protein blaR1